jgi:glutamate/tyrosine decarboxylase-like PLP-dependent enzyme
MTERDRRTAKAPVHEAGDANPDRTPTALDPADWQEFRRRSHQALDDMITQLETLEARPVWQPMPAAVRERFRQPLPHAGRDLAEVLADFGADIAPYATGNRHPLFMGWVHGAGTPVGMLGEMLAAGLNANCGGRDHVGIAVEQQVTRWVAEMFGLPGNASGLFVTGTSMANFLGLLVARNKALGDDVRVAGLKAAPSQLVAYASAQAHGCIAQALELAGVGSGNLRLIPIDGAGAMRIDALRQAIAADRQAGLLPFLVFGTAGSVNMGAVDDLDAIADIARAAGIWFHVDGAFGALATLSPALKPLLKGMERADSIGFDFHKWAHVPYDAGFLIVRDADAHRRTFAAAASYLQRAPRGLAAGETWPSDIGPDLSRGFRALKTWFTIQTLGADRIGAAIETCCAVARHLAASLEAEPLFEVVAPVTLNVVVWRVAGEVDDALNNEIVMDLHERGVAVPSMTTIAGRPAMRAAIVNHRTGQAHINGFVAELVATTRRLQGPWATRR